MAQHTPGVDNVVILVGGSPVSNVNPLPTSGGIVDQGKQGSIAQPWFVQPTADGATVSLPLPAGAATAAKQDTGNTSLSSIDGKVATETTLAAVETLLGAGLPAALSGGRLDVAIGATSVTQPVSGTVTANAGTGTFAISAASLPLPSGAATSTLQGAGLPAALVGGKLDVNLGTSSITLPVSAASLPLPSGAATAAKQPALGTAGTPSADVISVQGVAGGTNLPIALAAWFGSTAPTVGQKTSASSLPVVLASDGTVTAVGAAATGTAVTGNPVLIGGQDGTNARTLRLDGTGRPAGSSFQWRGAATSELLKSGAGVLRRVICGSNVAGTITLYDNTAGSGTVIASLTTTTSTPFNSVEINAAFATGLYAVSTGMSGGSYTIVWD